MRQFIFSLLLLFCIKNSLLAQDTLPKLSVKNLNNKILISWTNPFTLLTTINIQRSFDSTKNFTTIGSILDVKNKKNGYVDSKPLSVKIFYRVFLSFEGGNYLFTKSYRPIKDTIGVDSIKVKPDIKQPFDNSIVIPWFLPSDRVFTGKDNNVIISLPEARHKKYLIKFYDEKGTPLFELTKIPEPYLTLEKVNFLHSGVFTFEVFEDGLLIEKDKFYIPKETKIANGNNEQGKISR